MPPAAAACCTQTGNRKAPMNGEQWLKGLRKAISRTAIASPGGGPPDETECSAGVMLTVRGGISLGGAGGGAQIDGGRPDIHGP